MGRVWSRTKLDGVKLYYQYDGLGRLNAKASTDGSIAYAYSNDMHGNPYETSDAINQITQKRSYDLLNRLRQEEVSPGVVLKYDYDALGRLTEMILPDASRVAYEYDAFHLKRVRRFDAAGQLMYACDCSDYDMQGILIKISSPAGEIHYTYDLLSRPIHIETTGWVSSIKEFDRVGNLMSMHQTDPNGFSEGKFTYDRFDHLNYESFLLENSFQYDSLGNCLQKNNLSLNVNGLNQVVHDGQSAFRYDLNGNLAEQADPSVVYRYDALNRLTSCEQGNKKTSFVYDAFDRCLKITDDAGTKQLVYQGCREIGSWVDGKLQEFRLMHPDPHSEITFAIELNGEVFFPVQDYRNNISALRKKDGSLAQWYKYSAFGTETIFGDDTFSNPWRFANRREVAGLSLFTHRFYHTRLMRWLTTDPLGFEDGLNLYSYVHNNPFYYSDPDGRFAFVAPMIFPIVDIVFGAAFTATWLPAVGYTILTVLASIGVYEGVRLLDANIDAVEHPGENDEVKDNLQPTPDKLNNEKTKRKPYAPARPLPRTPYGIPIPDSTDPHTQIGTKDGTKGKYPQAREFDENGMPVRDIDFTDHGLPIEHTDPHQHSWIPNPTGGSKKRDDPMPLPEIDWLY